jgi:hypothetical protein
MALAAKNRVVNLLLHNLDSVRPALLCSWTAIQTVHVLPAVLLSCC